MEENQMYRKGEVWGLGCDVCCVIYLKWHDLDKPFDCPECEKRIYTPLSAERAKEIEMALYASLNAPNTACRRTLRRQRRPILKVNRRSVR